MQIFLNVVMPFIFLRAAPNAKPRNQFSVVENLCIRMRLFLAGARFQLPGDLYGVLLCDDPSHN